MSDDKYPRGKVRSDDEGVTQIALGIRNGTIYLNELADRLEQ